MDEGFTELTEAMEEFITKKTGEFDRSEALIDDKDHKKYVMNND